MIEDLIECAFESRSPWGVGVIIIIAVAGLMYYQRKKPKK